LNDFEVDGKLLTTWPLLLALHPGHGIFSIAHVPTGDSDLGSGHVQTFLPIWAQKSWGHGQFTVEAAAGLILGGQQGLLTVRLAGSAWNYQKRYGGLAISMGNSVGGRPECEYPSFG